MQSNECDPPYSDQARWLQRASREAHLGHTTASLVLASVSTRYWWRLVTTRGTVDLFRGRLAFIDPTTQEPKVGFNAASAVVWHGPAFAPGVVRWRSAETGELLDVHHAVSLRGAEVQAC